MYTTIVITPERDSDNSYPEAIHFEIASDSVKMTVNERNLTFSLKDFKKIVKVAEALESAEE